MLTPAHRLAVAILLPTLTGTATATAAPAADEIWRFTHARKLAPDIPALDDPASLQGQPLRFTATGLEGPAPFACTRGRTDFATVPAEGLFEGGLTAPVAHSAGFLGLGAGPYRLRRLTCAASDADIGFDFVEADSDTLLVALDGRIWTLSRAPGAGAPAETPEGRIQRLLEFHFASAGSFTAETIAAKTAWLSAPLRAAARIYFARPRPADEVPPIDGDPFANTQDPLTHFAVGTARVSGAHAVVPVRVATARGPMGLDYHLVRESGGWMLDDIFLTGDAGSSLRRILEQD